MIVYCQTGGIGDAIMGTAIISALQRRYGDVEIAHFEDLVKQVISESKKFPEDQLLDLSIVKKYYPDACMAVINKFRKDNDGELSFFYALENSMLEHVRRLRRIHLEGIKKMLDVSINVESLYDFNSFRLLQAMNRETNYFADWQRYSLDVDYDQISLPDSVSMKAAQELGNFIIVHDSRLPGLSGKSSYTMKAWYLNRWNELCSRLSKDIPVVQFIGGEQPLFQGAIPHTELIGDDAVFVDYLQLLRQCKIYVGTDSWPAHAAICINGPKFILLKGAVSRRWDHAGRYSHIVREGNCQSCEGPRGANSTCLWSNGTHQCMNMITVDMIYKLILEEI